MMALKEIELTEVPPSTIPTLKVVFGWAGTWRSPIRAMARPMAWIGLGIPKAPKLWPPGPANVTR